MSVRIRQAQAADAAAMHQVRVAVGENRLTSVALSERDYVQAIEGNGRGWVVEVQEDIVGFAIGNSENGSIWALFVKPEHEGNGYGRRLHDTAVAWLWAQGLSHLWLTTEAGTRAEHFYREAGWKFAGSIAGGEFRFELQRPNTRPEVDRQLS